MKAISELDIYRCAKTLTDQHGDNAAIYAAKRIDALEGEADFEGRRIWVRILAAIDVLQGRAAAQGSA